MKTLLLKISGELFKSQKDASCLDSALVKDLVQQVKQLAQTHHIGLVIGGGNLFRGTKEGAQLGLQRTTADVVGMLATVMNGLMLQDFFLAAGVPCTLLSAHGIHGTVQEVSLHELRKARKQNSVVIFAGGTGLSHCSTDTAAVMRALQMGASEVWKATTVEGVYDDDPARNPQAQLIKTVTYADVLKRNLRVMDLTAITLAQENGLTLRVFSIFAKNALLQVAEKSDFGSTIKS